LAAALAVQEARGELATGQVPDCHRFVARLGHPLVAPLPEGHHHRPQGGALPGEHVDVPAARLVVAAALHDPGLAEGVQPVREDVAGDAETTLEVVEPGHAEQGVADDQERPPLADDLERAGDRAVHVRERSPAHSAQDRKKDCIMQRSWVSVSFMMQSTPLEGGEDPAPAPDWSVESLRPLRPDDAEGLRQLVDRVSVTSLQRRFFTPVRALARAFMERLVAETGPCAGG